jgi:hypothetical protein
MAGTLVVDTISNGTVSTSSANVIQGCAKAWVAYNGTTSTIRSSYNVSSVTRIAAGRYTIIFTTAFSDANYAVTALTQQTGGGAFLVYGENDTPYTASQFTVTTSTTAALNDTTNLGIAVFR